VGLEHEALDALDGLGRDRLLAVALLERAAGLGDLLGQPVLALLEELADVGDLLGELGGHGRVHLRRLAAGLGDLEGERGLALLERLARVGELRLECGLAGLEGLADLGQLGQRVARGPARLVALAADLLERGAQLLDVLGGLALVGRQRGQLGADLSGLLAGAGGLGAQLVGQVAQRVEARLRLRGLALQRLEATAVLAGEALGLGLLNLDLGDVLAQALGLAANLLDALQGGGQLLAGGVLVALALALDALQQLLDLGGRGGGLLLALRAQALDLGAQLLAHGLEPLDPAGELAALGLGAVLDLGEGGGEARLGGLHGRGASALGLLDALDQLGAGGLGLRGGGDALGAGGGLVGERRLELGDALEQLVAVCGRGGLGEARLEPRDALQQLLTRG
jgi:hypothetical protein